MSHGKEAQDPPPAEAERSFAARLPWGPSRYSLTEQQAYLAMYLFLSAHESFAAEETIEMLVFETSLSYDWMPIEPAVWPTWLDCVRVAVGEPPTTGTKWAEIGLPRVVVHDPAAAPDTPDELRERPYLRGELALLTAADGGRTMPVWSGIGADALLEGAIPKMSSTMAAKHRFLDCRLVFDHDPVAPGAREGVRVFPKEPDSWASVQPGQEVGIYHGRHLIGRLLVDAAITE